jgi:hypothetical protein
MSAQWGVLEFLPIPYNPPLALTPCESGLYTSGQNRRNLEPRTTRGIEPTSIAREM